MIAGMIYERCEPGFQRDRRSAVDERKPLCFQLPVSENEKRTAKPQIKLLEYRVTN